MNPLLCRLLNDKVECIKEKSNMVFKTFLSSFFQIPKPFSKDLLCMFHSKLEQWDISKFLFSKT